MRLLILNEPFFFVLLPNKKQDHHFIAHHFMDLYTYIRIVESATIMVLDPYDNYLHGQLGAW